MKKIKDTYNKLAENYDSRYSSTIHFVEEQIISSFLPEKGTFFKCLDIGCGTGNMITVGEFEPDEYFGVDISKEMINVAKEKYENYRFEVGDIRDYKNLNADLVLSVFGQMNYMGIEDWCDVISNNLSDDGSFVSVVYSDIYKPDYLNGEVKVYNIEQIANSLIKEFQFSLWGLSFPPLKNIDYHNIWASQNFLSGSGQLDNCKYWIICGSKRGLHQKGKTPFKLELSFDDGGEVYN